MQKALSLWDLDKYVQSASQLPLKFMGTTSKQTKCFKSFESLYSALGRSFVDFLGLRQGNLHPCHHDKYRTCANSCSNAMACDVL